MVSTVLVDLGNVLVHVDPERTVALLAQISGKPADSVRQAAYGPAYRAMNRGDIDWRQFAQGLAEQLGIRGPLEAVADAWRASLTPYAEVIDAISGLAPHYRLVLLSNTDEVHFEHSRRIVPVLRRFAAFVLSCRVGSMKPEPAIYQEAVRQALCPAVECLFIDDVEANVRGATAVGIAGIQLQAPDQLRRELSDRGMLAKD